MLVIEETEILPIPAARAGDPEAWRTLFERFHLPLFSYISQLNGDNHASLDIIQDTFLNASRHIAALRADDKFPGWLFGIARQKVIENWRKKRVSLVSFEDSGLDETVEAAPSPSDFMILAEQESKFWKALQGLSLAHKEALTLFFLEEFSLEQIADLTGVSLGTVKSRLFYGRKKFKECYELE